MPAGWNSAQKAAVFQALFQKQRSRCWKCKRTKSKGLLTIHHVIYKSQGGPNDRWNLRLVCIPCHRAIHANDTTPETDGA